MRNLLKKYIWIVAGILLIVFLISRISWFPSIKNLFKTQPVVIDATPIVIQEIKTLASLITITYSNEIVMDTVQVGNGLPSLLPLNIGTTILPSVNKLVIIGRGKVIAGTDLSKMQGDDVIVSGDSVHVAVPHANILQTILNPSDFETFIEDGKWNDEAVTALKIKIRNNINEQAIQQGIPEKADARCKLILENYLMNTGFKKVTISFL
ncbi:MAG: DUF4230 domain-containing protein [Ginsengibacter sp.]